GRLGTDRPPPAGDPADATAAPVTAVARLHVVAVPGSPARKRLARAVVVSDDRRAGGPSGAAAQRRRGSIAGSAGGHRASGALSIDVARVLRPALIVRVR